jgi:hypothetical protein
MSGTEASLTGVVPRSGVTAPADVPTVESGCVPELSAGAATGCSPGAVVFFASTGALAAGVGLGAAGAFCPAACAATITEQDKTNANIDRAFILITSFEQLTDSERKALSSFSLHTGGLSL